MQSVCDRQPLMGPIWGYASPAHRGLVEYLGSTAARLRWEGLFSSGVRAITCRIPGFTAQTDPTHCIAGSQLFVSVRNRRGAVTIAVKSNRTGENKSSTSSSMSGRGRGRGEYYKNKYGRGSAGRFGGGRQDQRSCVDNAESNISRADHPRICGGSEDLHDHLKRLEGG